MDKENMPNHIAIIMDGNRRWAREKGLDYRKGHQAGADTIEKIVTYANEIGLKYMTVYAFSTENWKRTEEEVGALMLLFNQFLDKYIKIADTKNVKIRFIGDRTVLSKSLVDKMEKAEERTGKNTGLTFAVALNYGGRDELVHAIKSISQDVRNGKISEDEITDSLVSDYLYTKGMPDPDLVIRTSGELRTSNFLPWQIVYSEFLFLDKYWPDFSEEDLDKAIEVYQKRNRKFGAK